MAYYQWANHLLQRDHGRENHGSLKITKPLAPVEKVFLYTIILAVVEVSRDN